MPERGEKRIALRHKTAEVIVAALFLAFGAVVIFDSVRLGAGWASDGPRPGYFPFYVGLIICTSAAINLLRVLVSRKDKDRVFVLVEQLKLVLTVLVPAVIYAALVGWIGIYVSSILFITFFMRWLGKYAWWKVAAVSVGTMVAFYLIFELWFKVPLPKGPIEAFLGID
ncbi:MAG: tripartite tricarboxylate transporter TctB family protein [Burkholderiales bacterium]